MILKNDIVRCVVSKKYQDILIMGLLISKPKKKTKKVPEFATIKKNKTPPVTPRTKITRATVRLSTPVNQRKKQVERWFRGNITPNSKKKINF